MKIAVTSEIAPMETIRSAYSTCRAASTCVDPQGRSAQTHQASQNREDDLPRLAGCADDAGKSDVA